MTSPSWSGVEPALVDFLTVALGVRVCTELPADLADVAPVVQVVRIGGPHDDNDPFLLIPTVSVDCFADDRLAAITLADQVDRAMRKTLPGAQVHGASVGLVRTLTGPSWRPWDDTAVRRYGATYQVRLKTPKA